MIDSLLSQMYEKLSFNQNHTESRGEGMGDKILIDKDLALKLKNVKVVEEESLELLKLFLKLAISN